MMDDEKRKKLGMLINESPQIADVASFPNEPNKIIKEEKEAHERDLALAREMLEKGVFHFDEVIDEEGKVSRQLIPGSCESTPFERLMELFDDDPELKTNPQLAVDLARFKQEFGIKDMSYEEMQKEVEESERNLFRRKR